MPTGLGDEEVWYCPSLDDSADDISGNNRNGSYQGGMGTVADTAYGGTRAYSFDGVDDGVACGDILDSAIWTTGNAFTLTGWVYVTNSQLSADGATLLTKYMDNGANDRQFLNRVSNNGSGMKANFGYAVNNQSTYRFWQGSTVLSTGTWYHIVWIYNGPTATNANSQCFVNGVEETVSSFFSMGTDNAGMNDYAGELSFGKAIKGTLQNYIYKGRADDLRVFPRAITKAEITHLASSRGVEGAAPVGLGDELMWMCPTLNDSATDISANAYSGSYQGGMGTVADTTYGGTRAYSFDGVDDYVALGDISTEMSDQTETTVSFWFNKAPWTPQAGIVARRSTTTNHLWGVSTKGSTNSPNLQYTYSDNKERRLRLSFSYIPLGSWYHICLLFDGSQTGNAGRLKMYVNGTLNTNTTFGNTIAATTGTIASGGWALGSTGSGRYLNGKMDDIRIYTRAVTQAEITHLATSRGVEGTPPAAPTSVYDPFISRTFHNRNTGQIR